jgi:hypothetical protein
MKRFTLQLGVLLVVTLVSGCASLRSERLLPSSESTSKGFQSYDDAFGAFQMIYVGQTRISELSGIGFDPENSPNVTVMRYTDVVSLFLNNPSITKKDIPEGILDCLEAQGGCVAYRFQMEQIDEKRYGSFFADMLNFRKRTQTTGWRFEALIVVVDQTVAYALHSGQKHIDKHEVKRNPLGPLQDVGGRDVVKTVL